MDTTTQKYLGQDIIPVLKQKVNAKQDKLIGTGEGQNIKTINGTSILGSGDIAFPTAKLYSAYGTNTDGALDQNFASEKMQALEGEVAKTVQTDTKIGTDLSSTVNLVKTTGPLNGTQTDTEFALPVASESQAGVINPTIYATIQDNANQISVITKGSVVIENLAADVSQEQLTAAWKTETGLENLINGARIYDKTNGKQWTYYTNVNEWESADIKNPELVEIENFTNTKAGLIKGADVEGKVFAEADGTGSVKGWDTLSTSVTNNTTNITTLQTNVAELQTSVAEKQDTLIGTGEGQNIKTINGTSLLGAGDIEIETPEALTVAEFNALWEA